MAKIGEKSIRYEFEVRGGETVAATGNMVIAVAAPDSSRAVPWSADVRAALSADA